MQIEGFKLYITVWNDRYCKVWIHSAGVTVPGPPSSKRRQDPDTGITYRSLICCPDVIGREYYPNFGWVDRHNCLRHSSLRLEHTQKPDSKHAPSCSHL